MISYIKNEADFEKMPLDFTNSASKWQQKNLESEYQQPLNSVRG